MAGPSLLKTPHAGSQAALFLALALREIARRVLGSYRIVVRCNPKALSEVGNSNIFNAHRGH